MAPLPKLLIIGAGAQARYVLDTLALTREAEVVGLVDVVGDQSWWGRSILGCRVLGDWSVLDAWPPAAGLRLILADSDRFRKQVWADRLAGQGYLFQSVIHPTAVIAASATVASGCILNALVVVENQCGIGPHVILHAGCVVEHDTILEEGVNLGPRVVTAGRVRVEARAVVYSGAVVLPDRVIGREAVVGAGAVVTRDVPPGVTVAGVPAQPIR